MLLLPQLAASPARTARPADGVSRYIDRLARRQAIVRRDVDPRWLRAQRRLLRANGSLDVPRFAAEAVSRGVRAMYGELFGKIIHKDGSVTNLGLLGRRVITDAGVAYIAADIGGGASDSNLFKFHGFGTGSTAESASQTALVTELTTQYATDNTRPTGSQANSTNTYTTVATLSPDATVTITEHGIFTATSAGTMLDRTVFTGVALTGSADSLQATYVLTLPSGG